MHSVFVEIHFSKQTLKYTELKRDANLFVLYIKKSTALFHSSSYCLFHEFVNAAVYSNTFYLNNTRFNNA